VKRLIVHTEAELELWQAADYYETKASGLGLDFELEVRRAFFDIQEAPNRWPVRQNGACCFLLHRFPYAIYYIEIEDIIWIVAVAHMRREPYYWRNRLNQ